MTESGTEREILAELISITQKLDKDLYAITSDTSIPANSRSRIASGCFGATQEHIFVVRHLISGNMIGSACALMRVVFEAYVRGLWLLYCADDAQLERFITEDKLPRPNGHASQIDMLIGDLIERREMDGLLLKKYHSDSWKSMCSYTHTGALQVQRRMSATAIEPNYSIEECCEVLDFCNLIALMTDMQVAELAKEPAKQRQIASRADQYMEERKICESLGVV